MDLCEYSYNTINCCLHCPDQGSCIFVRFFGGGGAGGSERSYSTCITGIEKVLRNKLQNVEAIYVTVFLI